MTGPQLSARDHALRVAVLEAILEAAKAEYSKARKAAEPEFAAVRADGGKQLAVMLPGGDEIGLVSIKAGAVEVTVDDEDALMAWVREHCPDEIEQHADPGILSDAEVLDMLSACFPGSVKERVRPSARAALEKEMEDSGGFITDKETGETAKLGTVETRRPTGAFVLAGAGAQARRERIVAEWQRGSLREIALGPLALPAAADGTAGS